MLRRPDVFHAAIAGAPVTDWRLYDTFYTERYLGHPDTDAEVYDASSLLPDAPKLERPLLLVHGLADDNVVSAHTLQLSSALLAAGRPHQVLPLTGVTHMANQEEVAENLLLLQLAFLRAGARSLPTDATSAPPRGGASRGWAGKDLNLRRQCRLVYSQFPLATRARTQGCDDDSGAVRSAVMPSFDVVSEIDQQEIRNAVDQAAPRGRHPLRLQGHRHHDRAERRPRSSSTPRARTGWPPCARCWRRSW